MVSILPLISSSPNLFHTMEDRSDGTDYKWYHWQLHVPAVVFHKRLDDSKSLKVCRTHLSILSDFNGAGVRMVSILPIISNSPRIFSKPVESVIMAPKATDIFVTFTFHSFFSPLARPEYFSICWLSFIFSLWSVEKAKSTRWCSFFFLINTKSVFLPGFTHSYIVSTK